MDSRDCMPENRVLDLEGLLDNIGRDEELAGQLLDRTARDLPSRMGQLRDALEQGDPQAVHRVAHAMKGTLASIRADEASACARRVDDAARDGDIGMARAGFPALEGATERLLAAIRSRRRGAG